jgi:hypothetical protein
LQILGKATLAEPARAASTREWRSLTEVAAGCTALLDAALLQRKHGIFTGGFLSDNPLATAADGVAFFVALLVLNATLITPVCAIALLIGGRIGLRPWATRFAALSAAVLPLAAADFLSYQVWSYLGDAFDFRVVFDLTGRRLSELFAVTAPLIARPLTLGLFCFAAVFAATWMLHRYEPRAARPVTAPSISAVIYGTFAMFLGSAVLVITLAALSDSMDFGLRWTPSGQVLGRVLNWLSDFDRDGYGLLRAPRDPAPFDGAIHPYALEIPGNGIDEDGIGGDLPIDRAGYREAPAPNAAWPDRPAVILFVLESFRADVVGASFAGRPVTPVMDSLARDGLKVDSAWSHNGFTAQSRFHILSGSLSGGRNSTTLLDDFKNHGYEVGYFSAQDDSFGQMGISYERVDTYYDARQDPDKRYTSHTTPGSLAVPMNVLAARIEEFLDSRRQTAPLFLYVNFHDTHYPYTHTAVENILGTPLLSPALISPGRRAELWRTYLNTAANVDRAIGRVMRAVTSKLGGEPAAVIISDHGESLFEGGFLGHGYALNDPQTRVPLIIHGLPMRIREPFGQSDLRDAINDALASGAGAQANRPTLDRTTKARVFQYVGTLETPGQIGWLTRAGQVTYDFRTDRFGVWNAAVKPAALVGEPLNMFRDLVYTWESMKLAQRKSANAP